METKATLRGAHLSAQKGRLVADLVRGKKVDQAIDILAFSPKAGAALIKKLLAVRSRSVSTRAPRGAAPGC